ncbi:MAG TPA: hypothetical protein VKU85_01305 [bacterium]|nr:hypothetical protein [bacterium]
MRPPAPLCLAAVCFTAVYLTALPAGAAPELTPRVGFDFEHFGETYRVTADRDTAATINDYGPVVGLALRVPGPDRDRFRMNADLHVGRETRRVGLDFEWRLERGPDAWELEHDGSYRAFTEDGDYSISSNALDERVQLIWDRRLGDDVRLRVRESVALTWFEDPDAYNLNTVLHRPGAEVRWAFGELNEARLGYRLGRRDVPDSSSLDYWRHTVDADFSFLLGWSAALDVSTQLERRKFPEESVRESSWEARNDVRLELGTLSRVTYRLVHENELIRFEEPDGYVDFDYSWARTGFQVELHRGTDVDFSVTPLYTFLISGSAPQEEYTEAGVELGLDWRVGESTWISITDEGGHRDYEIDAVEFDPASTDIDLTADQLLADAAYSDFVLNRLTVLVTSEVAGGVSVNLFAHWQPENHRLNLHDSDTRIVSGGVEYRF